MTTTPAENVAAVAAVETVVAAAEASIEEANERAAAAAEVGVLITEAAIQREISERVDDVEEGLETCENQNAAMQAQITSLSETLATLQQSLTTLVTMEMLTAALQPPAAPPPLIPQPPNNPTAEATTNPAAAVGVHPEAEPAKEKPSRYRLT